VDESGKGLGFDGLGTQVAGHVEWVADDEGAAGVSTGQASQGADIVTLVGAGQREDGLGGQPKSIGDSYADASVAYVQSHEAEQGWDWLPGFHGVDGSFWQAEVKRAAAQVLSSCSGEHEGSPGGPPVLKMTPFLFRCRLIGRLVGPP
jgi:hypothetical protein